jgi:hypothetical protein
MVWCLSMILSVFMRDCSERSSLITLLIPAFSLSSACLIYKRRRCARSNNFGDLFIVDSSKIDSSAVLGLTAIRVIAFLT